MNKILAFICLTFPFILLPGGGVSVQDIQEQKAPEISKKDWKPLEKLLEGYIAKREVPGVAVKIFDREKTLYESYFGSRDMEKNWPVNKNTRFRLASLTKPIVSIAVLQLMDQGDLKLDDPVSKYIPAFKKMRVFEQENRAVEQITIQHLLTHNSGLTSAIEGGPVAKLYEEKNLGYYLDNLGGFVNKLAEFPLAAQPGRKFLYGFSTDVLGRIIEIVSGQPLDKYLQENLFNPLDMKNTGYQLPEEEKNHLATLYRYNKEKQLIPVFSATRNTYVKGVLPRGNYGLISTLEDYSNFVSMLLNGGRYGNTRILKEETVKLLSTNHLPENQLPLAIGGMPFKGLGFGLGVSVSIESNPLGYSQGSFGWIGASQTYFWVDPDKGIAGLMFSQFSYTGPSGLIWEFNGKVYECLNKAGLI